MTSMICEEYCAFKPFEVADEEETETREHPKTFIRSSSSSDDIKNLINQSTILNYFTEKAVSKFKFLSIEHSKKAGTLITTEQEILNQFVENPGKPKGIVNYQDPETKEDYPVKFNSINEVPWMCDVLHNIPWCNDDIQIFFKVLVENETGLALIETSNIQYTKVEPGNVFTTYRNDDFKQLAKIDLNDILDEYTFIIPPSGDEGYTLEFLPIENDEYM